MNNWSAISCIEFATNIKGIYALQSIFFSPHISMQSGVIKRENCLNIIIHKKVEIKLNGCNNNPFVFLLHFHALIF